MNKQWSKSVACVFITTIKSLVVPLEWFAAKPSTFVNVNLNAVVFYNHVFLQYVLLGLVSMLAISSSMVWNHWMTLSPSAW
jgi:hypothetical protein